MRNIYIFTSIVAFICFIGCDSKTPEQRVKYESDMARNDRMKREVYIDSVVNVALGVGKYEHMRENRINALNILKEEYPSMTQKWDSIEISIRSN